jgi:predicted Ser/Thr protein kinase
VSPLSQQEWARANQIFHDALETPPEHRAAFVADAAGGDARLESEVRSLLAFHAHADSFLETAELNLSLEGQQLGPYRVVREVGHGGMGVVYLAEDTRLGRSVALKAIPQAWTDDADRRERLRHEARAAAALSHPGVAVIYALEDIDGRLYLSSEFVRGSNLREELQHGALPLSTVVSTAQDLADALAAAHDRGIVHRDLKPDNVMRTPEGRVKIIDFGVAGFGPAEGGSPGTPGYMAPEQGHGGVVDVRADHYALGVLLHELATGRHPFSEGPSRPPLDATNPVAAILDRIIARCLEPDPADRFPTTHALVEAVGALDAAAAVASRPPAPDSVPPPAATFSPLWWWQFHQLVTSLAYGIVLYFLWAGRDWLPGPAGQWLFLAGLTGALTANTLRLHLWFTSRFYPEEWNTQRQSVWIWNRLADFLLGIVLLLAGARHLETHPVLSALFLGSAIAVLIAFTIIEPATTRAAAKRLGR